MTHLHPIFTNILKPFAPPPMNTKELYEHKAVRQARELIETLAWLEHEAIERDDHDRLGNYAHARDLVVDAQKAIHITVTVL